MSVTPRERARAACEFGRVHVNRHPHDCAVCDHIEAAIRSACDEVRGEMALEMTTEVNKAVQETLDETIRQAVQLCDERIEYERARPKESLVGVATSAAVAGSLAAIKDRLAGLKDPQPKGGTP